MSRTVKQFIYGAGYLIFVALIVIAALPSREPEPAVTTPNTGSFRQLEMRGPVTVMTAADGNVALLARVRNPNETYLAAPFSYSFRVTGSGEAGMTTPVRTETLYPLETSAILEIVPSPTFTEDSEVALLLGNPTWAGIEFSLRPSLTLRNTATRVDGIGLLVEGTVTNAGAVAASRARILAIVNDANGFPLFAAQTVLENLAGGASRDFFIRFPRDEGLATRALPDKTEILIYAQ